MSNFFQRLILGGIFSLILFLAIFFSDHILFQPILVLIAGLFICGALWEYYAISKGNGSEPVGPIGIIGSMCYIYVLYMSIADPAFADWPIITLGLILFSAFLSYFFAGMNPFSNLAVTMFGVVYLTVPLAFMIPINFVFGKIWLAYLLLVTKLTDVGAYFIGKQFGSHLMAPVISPKKTWEGALGGLLIGTLTSYALHKICSYYGYTLFETSLQSIGFGALMSVIAQIGDLSESLLKRDGRVQDSSKLPGLGGMLDIVDSLVFTTPLLFFFLKLYLIKNPIS